MKQHRLEACAALCECAFATASTANRGKDPSIQKPDTLMGAGHSHARQSETYATPLRYPF